MRFYNANFTAILYKDKIKIDLENFTNRRIIFVLAFKKTKMQNA